MQGRPAPPPPRRDRQRLRRDEGDAPFYDDEYSRENQDPRSLGHPSDRDEYERRNGYAENQRSGGTSQGTGSEHRLRVCFCHTQTGEEARDSVLSGHYQESGSNHGKPTFQKDDGKVSVYFWDQRDGPELSGWWFGSSVGGEEIWAQHTAGSFLPPERGWKVVTGGYPDQDLVVRSSSKLEPSASQRGGASDLPPGSGSSGVHDELRGPPTGAPTPYDERREPPPNASASGAHRASTPYDERREPAPSAVASGAHDERRGLPSSAGAHDDRRGAPPGASPSAPYGDRRAMNDERRGPAPGTSTAGAYYDDRAFDDRRGMNDERRGAPAGPSSPAAYDDRRGPPGNFPPPPGHDYAPYGGAPRQDQGPSQYPPPPRQDAPPLRQEPPPPRQDAPSPRQDGPPQPVGEPQLTPDDWAKADRLLREAFAVLRASRPAAQASSAAKHHQHWGYPPPGTWGPGKGASYEGWPSPWEQSWDRREDRPWGKGDGKDPWGKGDGKDPWGKGDGKDPWGKGDAWSRDSWGPLPPHWGPPPPGHPPPPHWGPLPPPVGSRDDPHWRAWEDSRRHWETSRGESRQDAYGRPPPLPPPASARDSRDDAGKGGTRDVREEDRWHRREDDAGSRRDRSPRQGVEGRRRGNSRSPDRDQRQKRRRSQSRSRSARRGSRSRDRPPPAPAPPRKNRSRSPSRSWRNRSASRSRSRSPNVEDFLANHSNVDEKIKQQLRDMPWRLQKIVIENPSMQGARDPTAVLISRMRAAKEKDGKGAGRDKGDRDFKGRDKGGKDTKGRDKGDKDEKGDKGDKGRRGKGKGGDKSDRGGDGDDRGSKSEKREGDWDWYEAPKPENEEDSSWNPRQKQKSPGVEEAQVAPRQLISQESLRKIEAFVKQSPPPAPPKAPGVSQSIAAEMESELQGFQVAGAAIPASKAAPLGTISIAKGAMCKVPPATAPAVAEPQPVGLVVPPKVASGKLGPVISKLVAGAAAKPKGSAPGL